MFVEMDILKRDLQVDDYILCKLPILGHPFLDGCLLAPV